MFRRSSTSARVSAQTVRLARGRHRSAQQGACVMELSTMLVGETFSDHPESVCPVLAAFLRSYNDHLPKYLRPRLYPWASDAVGTRTEDPRVEARRVAALVSLSTLLNGRPRRWYDRCLCAQGEAAAAGVAAAHAVRFQPSAQERIDRDVREIFGIRDADLGAAPPPPAPPAPARTPEPPVAHA